MSAPSLTARRRARLTLAGLAAAALVLVLLTALLIAKQLSAHPPATGSTAAAPAQSDGGDWDWVGEAALATRPMPYSRPQAAQPQTLAPRSGRPALRLPAPTVTTSWIATGFPDTPEGALAQLAALDEQGMRGGDPQVYGRAYAELSAPNAPAAAASRLSNYLVDIRSRAHLPASGPVPELSFSYQPTHGLIKGVLDGGRYAVVCVLGQFTADFQGRDVDAGTGDCQAMRYLPDPTSPTGGTWRISPGAPAASAADAWPGSQDSINAGYQELAR
jgi:hypothetical protein